MKISVLIVFIACFTACRQQGAVEEEQDESARVSADTIQVVAYRTRLEKLSYPVKAIGKVRSAERSSLIFERSGIIELLTVKNGEKVQKGQVIATLRNDSERLQKENATISLKTALVNYENQMLALGDSAYYKKNWDKVRGNVKLNSGVLAAEVALKQAVLAFDQTIIHAPITGIIEGIDLQAGDFVTSNSPLGSIYDPSAYEVTCELLEYDVVKVKRGMNADVYPLSDKTIALKGTIQEVNPAVDSKGLSRVVIQLENSKKLLPGLTTRVEINITDEPSIVVPLQAVVKRSERHVVFNIESGLAKWNYVTLGKDNGQEVQVLEGLEENMEVIVSNNLQLAHDSPVKLE